MTIHDLPALNAALNGLATVLLVVALIFIKQRRIAAHRATMIAAFAVSCVFLVFYVAHKIAVRGVHTPFGGEGAIRSVYYAMLLSHIVLAMAIVPLALITLFRGLKRDDARHKKIARLTWPIWFYVSVTGVLVYFMLYVWFPAPSTLERRRATAAAPTLDLNSVKPNPRLEIGVCAFRRFDSWRNDAVEGIHCDVWHPIVHPPHS